MSKMNNAIHLPLIKTILECKVACATYFGCTRVSFLVTLITWYGFYSQLVHTDMYSNKIINYGLSLLLVLILVRGGGGGGGRVSLWTCHSANMPPQIPIQGCG